MYDNPEKKDIFYTIPGYEGDTVITCSYCMGKWTLPKDFLGEYACGSCGRYITIKDGKDKP